MYKPSCLPHCLLCISGVAVFTLPEKLRKLVLTSAILCADFLISHVSEFSNVCVTHSNFNTHTHTRFWVFSPPAALVWLEWLKVLTLPGHSYHPEPLWRVCEPQDALHAGHLSMNRSEGEMLQERRQEKEEFHSGQRLP